MSRKGLILFSLAGLFWGIPYFFIAIALESFSTQTIVFARTAIGAIILIPYAIKTGALKPALKAWPYVLLFASLEMIGPWFLITEAQKHISSGLAGLLVATVPFYAVAILAIVFKDRTALQPVPLSGMLIGFLGVGTIIGIDSILGNTSVVWVGAVVLAALGYATAAIMASRKLQQVPTAGTVGLSMLIVALAYSIPASSFIPQELANNPPMESWVAILILGVVCSAVAFVIFFKLLREVGAVKATLITYVNTAVAILLGAIFLAEPFTPGLIAGIPFIAIGLYLSTKRSAPKKMPQDFLAMKV